MFLQRKTLTIAYKVWCKSWTKNAGPEIAGPKDLGSKILLRSKRVTQDLLKCKSGILRSPFQNVRVRSHIFSEDHLMIVEVVGLALF